MIASAGKDKTIKIWNLKETKEKFGYKTHTASINSVAFNKNSNSVLSASNDCTTKMFNIDTGNPSLILAKHNDFVRQAVFGFNDDLIITTGD
jgi:WD40 repeat protein